MFVTKQGLTSSPSSVPTKKIAPTISVGGVVYGWSDALGRYVAQAPARFRNPPMPDGGRFAVTGSSTTALSITVTSGTTLPSHRSPLGEANILLGSPYEIGYFGYSGQTNDQILTHLPEVYAWMPDILDLQLSANNLDSTAASAESAFATLQATAIDAMSRGFFVVVQTPHHNGSNWRGALHYDTLCQEWCASVGIPVISGVYSIASGADKVGTAKAGSMADTLHINDVGARRYGAEGFTVLRNNVVRRVLPGGSAQVASELFANPRMTGSVAVSGTGFSGTGPSDWAYSRSGSPTVVVSKGSDGSGDYMDLTITSTASDESVSITDATFQAANSAHPTLKYRHITDYEVITPGLCESVRALLQIGANVLQIPNANSPSFSGSLSAGVRQIVSPIIDSAVAGVPTAGQTIHGIRLSFSGAGTSVIRIRGISARESRW